MVPSDETAASHAGVRITTAQFVAGICLIFLTVALVTAELRLVVDVTAICLPSAD
jgi:hypothetical protein